MYKSLLAIPILLGCLSIAAASTTAEKLWPRATAEQQAEIQKSWDAGVALMADLPNEVPTSWNIGEEFVSSLTCMTPTSMIEFISNTTKRPFDEAWYLWTTSADRSTMCIEFPVEVKLKEPFWVGSPANAPNKTLSHMEIWSVQVRLQDGNWSDEVFFVPLVHNCATPAAYQSCAQTRES